MNSKEFLRKLPKRKLVAQYSERRKAPCQAEVVKFLSCLRENGFKEENCSSAIAALASCEASMRILEEIATERKERYNNLGVEPIKATIALNVEEDTFPGVYGSTAMNCTGGDVNLNIKTKIFMTLESNCLLFVEMSDSHFGAPVHVEGSLIDIVDDTWSNETLPFEEVELFLGSVVECTEDELPLTEGQQEDLLWTDLGLQEVQQEASL
eukprot:jgi/Galph1/3660/GphlegSOOS_G2343.1